MTQEEKLAKELKESIVGTIKSLSESISEEQFTYYNFRLMALRRALAELKQ